MSPKFCFLVSLSLVMSSLGWSMAHAQDHGGHIQPLVSESAPHLVVSPPLSGPLSKGLAVIKFRTENLKIMPIYGEAATKVVPRLGHLHVTVDDGPWHWLHSSDEPIVIQGLMPGQHRVLVELAEANHNVLEAQTVSFEIPAHNASK